MIRAIFIIMTVLLSGNLQSQTISQWRGAQRNGIYQENNLQKEWPEGGATEIWSTDQVGTGWGSASVTKDGVYLTGKIDTIEYCSKVDLEGSLVWQVAIGKAWLGSYSDARSTPTVIDNKVYVISGQGMIACLDAATGEFIWSLDGYSKFEGYHTMWGVCESPLIVGNRLIYTPGGDQTTMVALDKETGETVWMSESLKDSTGYVSPLLINHNGREIITTILANYFIGVDAGNGEILWNFKYYDLKWEQDHWYSPIININTPVYSNGKIYIAKGYNHLGALFTLAEDGSDVSLVRTDSVLDVHLGGMVLHDGSLYGANWLNNSDGNWCNIDWESGRVNYEFHWQSKGSIIMADGLFYCYEEKRGNVALVRPHDSEFDIVSSFRIGKGSGPHWAHPVIRDGRLYIRHGKFLMAFNIAEEQ
jgi:outer membrane protein assembly factor BamB